MLSFIPIPWRLLGVLLAVLGLFLSGYLLGQRHAREACVAGQGHAQAAAQAQATAVTAQREAVAVQRETAREQIRVVYRTIKERAHETVKKHPEFNTCGLDADGLREWNAANAGTAAPVRSEPNDPLPAATTGALRESGGAVEQSH